MCPELEPEPRFLTVKAEFLKGSKHQLHDEYMEHRMMGHQYDVEKYLAETDSLKAKVITCGGKIINLDEYRKLTSHVNQLVYSSFITDTRIEYEFNDEDVEINEGAIVKIIPDMELFALRDAEKTLIRDNHWQKEYSIHWEY